MLRLAKDLNSFTLEGRDGEIGKVKEFYFDDRSWTIRYLIADTSNRLSDQRVLISPYALGKTLTEEKLIRLDLTKSQIKNSPAIDTDKPVSGQYELMYYPYYGLPFYWGGASLWGECCPSPYG